MLNISQCFSLTFWSISGRFILKCLNNSYNDDTEMIGKFMLTLSFKPQNSLGSQSLNYVDPCAIIDLITKSNFGGHDYH